MRAAIEWSYQLLREPERRLLDRLAVFRGGWDLEAAEAVGAGGDILAEEILDLLTLLVEQSMVAVESHQGGATRYRILVPIREYAEERLIQRGEAEGTRRRHAAYFLAMAERAEPRLSGRDAGFWFGRLSSEHDNLGAALAWLLSGAAGGAPERAELADWAMRLATALWLFWEVHGHVSEGRGWLEAALAADAGASAGVRGRALGTAGWMAMWQGELERARALLEESVGLCRQLGDKPAVAGALHKLSTAALFQGDLGRARTLFEESVALWREFGDRARIAEPLNALGTVLLEQGDPERATTLFEESLEIGRASEDQLSTARALYSLAYAALERGEYGPAMALIAESMDIFQQLGHTLSIVYCLEIAAGVAAMRKDAAHAARLWGASEVLREALGTPRPTADRRYGRYLEATRAQLDDESYARAEAEGREMTLEQAVEYALSCDQRSQRD